jgi:hypothetical protein
MAAICAVISDQLRAFQCKVGPCTCRHSKTSYGYHSDGTMQCCAHEEVDAELPPFSVGDIVGAGVLHTSSTRRMFFTCASVCEAVVKAWGTTVGG